MFNAEMAKNECIKWIQDWFKENGPECNAVIGISGGKDSTVTAALCVEALGKDRVIGVMMPNGEQSDIDDSYQIAKHLGIKHITIDIFDCCHKLLTEICFNTTERISEQTIINLPPRIRMTTLYAISQSHNGRVVNTSNLTEEFVGYSTRWGDNVGDFSPLGALEVSEVIAIGHALNLPKELIEKTPSDGLCGKSDEDNLGFTYKNVEDYKNNSTSGDPEIDKKIYEKSKKNSFKSSSIKLPTYFPSIDCRLKGEE